MIKIVPEVLWLSWLWILVPVLCCLFASRTLLHYFQLESYQFPGYFRTLWRKKKNSFMPVVCAVIVSLLATCWLPLPASVPH